jgi:hypothetical protein
MKIKNKKTGQVFPTTKDVWENTIVGKGFGDKYDVVEDDKPIELKQLSVELINKKKKK